MSNYKDCKNSSIVDKQSNKILENQIGNNGFSERLEKLDSILNSNEYN